MIKLNKEIFNISNLKYLFMVLILASACIMGNDCENQLCSDTTTAPTSTPIPARYHGK